MADPRPGPHRASHGFNVAMLVLGAAMLAWLLRGLDRGEMTAALGRVDRRFAVILGLDLAAVLLDARACTRSCARKLG